MTAAPGMVEKVAEAIAIAGNGGTWDDWYNPAQKEFHRKRARAAIEAMLQATNEMREAGATLDEMLDVARVYQMTPPEIGAQRQSWVRGMTTGCEHGVLDFEQCPECLGRRAETRGK